MTLLNTRLTVTLDGTLGDNEQDANSALAELEKGKMLVISEVLSLCDIVITENTNNYKFNLKIHTMGQVFN